MSEDPEFASTLPESMPTISDVSNIITEGPWPSKSGANLVRRAHLTEPEVVGYFSRDPNELARVSPNILGARFYTVRGIPKAAVGGQEFHRIRQERLFGLEGEIEFNLEDVLGNKQTFVLNETTGLFIPPFVLHTYVAKTEGAGLWAIANNRYEPTPDMKDTYSEATFRVLQENYRQLHC